MIGDQLSLGDILKAEGMDRADKNAGAQWKAEADAAILKWAATGWEFTADDIRLLVPEPTSTQAWGSRYQQAAKRGWITNPDGRRRKSTHPATHAATVAVWRGTPLAARLWAERQDVAA